MTPDPNVPIPTSLCIFGPVNDADGKLVGCFTVYERCVGLSNSVKRLGRVFVPEWEDVESGEKYLTHEMVEQFRSDPTMYDNPSVPEPDEPRAA